MSHKQLIAAFGAAVVVLVGVFPVSFGAAHEEPFPDPIIHLRGFAPSSTPEGMFPGDESGSDGIFGYTFVHSALTLDGYAEGDCPPMMAEIYQPVEGGQDVDFDLMFVVNTWNAAKTGKDHIVDDLEWIASKHRVPDAPRFFDQMEETGLPLSAADHVFVNRQNTSVPIKVTGPFTGKTGTTPSGETDTHRRYHVSIPGMRQGMTQLYFCPRLTDEMYRPEEGYFIVDDPVTKEAIRIRRSEVSEGGSVPEPTTATTLTVKKIVINNDGGVLEESDVVLSVDDLAVISGVATEFGPGTHWVTEETVEGYTATFAGDCNPAGKVHLDEGDHKVCLLINDDVPTETSSDSRLTLVKYVVNNDGGTSEISDFSLFANAIPFVSGVTQSVPKGPYQISETGPEGYEATYTGDCNKNGKLAVPPGKDRMCIIINDDVAL